MFISTHLDAEMNEKAEYLVNVIIDKIESNGLAFDQCESINTSFLTPLKFGTFLLSFMTYEPYSNKIDSIKSLLALDSVTLRDCGILPFLVSEDTFWEFPSEYQMWILSIIAYFTRKNIENSNRLNILWKTATSSLSGIENDLSHSLLLLLDTCLKTMIATKSETIILEKGMSTIEVNEDAIESHVDYWIYNELSTILVNILSNGICRHCMELLVYNSYKSSLHSTVHLSILMNVLKSDNKKWSYCHPSVYFDFRGKDGIRLTASRRGVHDNLTSCVFGCWVQLDYSLYVSQEIFEYNDNSHLTLVVKVEKGKLLLVQRMKKEHIFVIPYQIQLRTWYHMLFYIVKGHWGDTMEVWVNGRFVCRTKSYIPIVKQNHSFTVCNGLYGQLGEFFIVCNTPSIEEVVKNTYTEYNIDGYPWDCLHEMFYAPKLVCYINVFRYVGTSFYNPYCQFTTVYSNSICIYDYPSPSHSLYSLGGARIPFPLIELAINSSNNNCIWSALYILLYMLRSSLSYQYDCLSNDVLKLAAITILRFPKSFFCKAYIDYISEVISVARFVELKRDAIHYLFTCESSWQIIPSDVILYGMQVLQEVLYNNPELFNAQNQSLEDYLKWVDMNDAVSGETPRSYEIEVSMTPSYAIDSPTSSASPMPLSLVDSTDSALAGPTEVISIDTKSVDGYGEINLGSSIRGKSGNNTYQDSSDYEGDMNKGRRSFIQQETIMHTNIVLANSSTNDEEERGQFINECFSRLFNLYVRTTEDEEFVSPLYRTKVLSAIEQLLIPFSFYPIDPSCISYMMGYAVLETQYDLAIPLFRTLLLLWSQHNSLTMEDKKKPKHFATLFMLIPSLGEALLMNMKKGSDAYRVYSLRILMCLVIEEYVMDYTEENIYHDTMKHIYNIKSDHLIIQYIQRVLSGDCNSEVFFCSVLQLAFSSDTYFEDLTKVIQNVSRTKVFDDGRASELFYLSIHHGISILCPAMLHALLTNHPSLTVDMQFTFIRSLNYCTINEKFIHALDYIPRWLATLVELVCLRLPKNDVISYLYYLVINYEQLDDYTRRYYHREICHTMQDLRKVDRSVVFDEAKIVEDAKALLKESVSTSDRYLIQEYTDLMINIISICTLESTINLNMKVYKLLFSSLYYTNRCNLLLYVLHISLQNVSNHLRDKHITSVGDALVCVTMFEELLFYTKFLSFAHFLTSSYDESMTDTFHLSCLHFSAGVSESLRSRITQFENAIVSFDKALEELNENSPIVMVRSAFKKHQFSMENNECHLGLDCPHGLGHTFIPSPVQPAMCMECGHYHIFQDSQHHDYYEGTDCTLRSFISAFATYRATMIPLGNLLMEILKYKEIEGWAWSEYECEGQLEFRLGKALFILDMFYLDDPLMIGVIKLTERMNIFLYSCYQRVVLPVTRVLDQSTKEHCYFMIGLFLFTILTYHNLLRRIYIYSEKLEVNKPENDYLFSVAKECFNSLSLLASLFANSSALSEYIPLGIIEGIQQDLNNCIRNQQNHLRWLNHSWIIKNYRTNDMDAFFSYVDEVEVERNIENLKEAVYYYKAELPVLREKSFVDEIQWLFVEEDEQSIARIRSEIEKKVKEERDRIESINAFDHTVCEKLWVKYRNFDYDTLQCLHMKSFPSQSMLLFRLDESDNFFLFTKYLPPVFSSCVVTGGKHIDCRIPKRDAVFLNYLRHSRDVSTLPKYLRDKFVPSFITKNAILIYENVQFVIPSSHFPGFIIVTKDYLYLSTDFYHTLVVSLNQILSIIPHRDYLYDHSVDITLCNSSIYCLTFSSVLERNEFVNHLLSLNLPSILQKSSIPSDCFTRGSYTELWTHNLISNYDYLVYINRYCGRSKSSLYNYYIFPWVLRDYSSNSLDLGDNRVYRDLSRPIGALSGKLDEHSHHYYSSFDIVLSYMVRIYPFSNVYIDRLHSSSLYMMKSIPEMWKFILTEDPSHRECIPEFYYLYELYEVNGDPDSHRLIGDTDVCSVDLPPWAHGHMKEFVWTMRCALESEYVSNHLHEWIDLIFGYKQRENNAFYDYSDYSGMFSKEEEEDKNSTAMKHDLFRYGVLPHRLFVGPHPQKSVFTSIPTMPSPISTSPLSSPRSPANSNSSYLIERFSYCRKNKFIDMFPIVGKDRCIPFIRTDHYMKASEVLIMGGEYTVTDIFVDQDLIFLLYSNCKISVYQSNFDHSLTLLVSYLVNDYSTWNIVSSTSDILAVLNNNRINPQIIPVSYSERKYILVYASKLDVFICIREFDLAPYYRKEPLDILSSLGSLSQSIGSPASPRSDQSHISSLSQPLLGESVQRPYSLPFRLGSSHSSLSPRPYSVGFITDSSTTPSVTLRDSSSSEEAPTILFSNAAKVLEIQHELITCFEIGEDHQTAGFGFSDGSVFVGLMDRNREMNKYNAIHGLGSLFAMNLSKYISNDFSLLFASYASSDEITAICVSSIKGIVATIDSSNHVFVYDIVNCTRIYDFHLSAEQNIRINIIVVSSFNYIVFVDNRSRKIHVYSFNGRLINSFPSPTRIRHMVLTPFDHRLVACGFDGILYFFDSFVTLYRKEEIPGDEFTTLFIDKDRKVLYGGCKSGALYMYEWTCLFNKKDHPYTILNISSQMLRSFSE